MGKNSDWSKESYRERNNNIRDDYNDKHRNSSGNYRSYANNRSSEIRNDDYYANDDEYTHDDNRKHRHHQNDHHNNHHRHHRDYYHHDRNRRSRSRSGEREYFNNRSQQESDYYSSNTNERYKEKKEIPNNTLIIRNLPPHVTDNEIKTEVNRYGLHPKDIRLMRNKETGLSRGFGFIEFSTIEEATQLKQSNQDYLVLEGEHHCSLHYSFSKDSAPNVDKSCLKGDWCCPKCGINNFKRRDECFKCGTSKDEYEDTQSSKQSINQQTNVLLLRNLSPSTTEETVLYKIGTLTSLPIKSIRIVNDSQFPSTNVCYLELHSIYEASDLLEIILSMPSGFMMDNHIITVTYGKRSESIIPSSSFAPKNAALAALAAAQWKNLDDTSKTLPLSSSSKPEPATVMIKGVSYTKYPFPDYDSFQYDSTSGFYYDRTTGFYYDSNSQYFYNSETQKYMYYDSANQVYISVDSDGQVSDQKKDKTQDNMSKIDSNKTDSTKMAKKIAKDMEKWAKKLNQQQVISKPTTVPIIPCNTDNQTEDSSTTSISSSSSVEKVQQIASLMASNKSNNISTKSESITDPFEIIRAEEERMIDRKRLACLLCKRQFNSQELLAKHQKLSELHKTNLSVLRQTILNEEQLEQVANIEREMAYRDRAKERRDKFGIDDTPKYSAAHKFALENASIDQNASIASPPPISNDNIGNKMLKAMGWTEGTGLGKSNQGMSGVIEVTRRKSGLGLGSQNATYTRESYKEAVKRTALQRFKEMNES
ncbi:RNA-binding protein 5 [Sarcoptes scabiei]|nr:RNA-binding protein 5 [Sarcoptes scabiei]